MTPTSATALATVAAQPAVPHTTMMEISAIPVARLQPRRLSDSAFDLLCVAIAYFAYLTVFIVVRSERGVADAALSSLINLLPLILLAPAFRALISHYLVGSTSIRQLIGHLALAPSFALLWYWLIMVLMGVRSEGSFVEFAVRAFFPGPVFAWQLLQGLTVYGLIAALTYLRAQPELPTFVGAPAPSQIREPDFTPYFIRRGDDILPVDIATIVRMAGADDYTELVTAEATHLVRTTLSEFERSLDPAKFVRVHRSHIVSLEWIARAEPSGGGRMLLHMRNGEMVQTSRSGGKLLRERVV
jgi:two-component system, LytTR family, response regulator